MKIGIFDSGLGGLIIAKAIRKAMLEYDYVYLGDTKRVPYGNRSHEAVYEFTKEAVSYLFKKENCAIIIIACNTSSARALRRMQQEYLVNYNHTRKIMGESERKILGVLIPTAEECAKYEKVGILGTLGTVSSDTFPREIKKINKKTRVFQSAAPMLVPLIEEGEKVLAKQFIKKYLKPFLNKKLDAVVLGCTHYPFYKNEIKKVLNKGSKSAKGRTRVISQDEIIPKKLKEYFVRHPEIEKKLAKNKKAKILVTDITPNIKKLSQKWFGKNTRPELIHL
ncbi:MAG: glutamate racemase [Candidatus Nomurabacteria bacterium]|nr:glutamate racemase [Candidatus Nomurabacteria bacterium]